MALVSNPAMTAASTATLKGSRTRSRLKTMLVVLLAVIVSLLVILFRSPEQAAAARAQRLEMLQQQRAETALHVERLRNLAHKVQEAIQNGDQFTQASFLRRSSAFSAMLESLERLASANHLQPQETTYRINPPDNDLGL